MIENTATDTAMMADHFDLDDPQAIIDAHAAAVASGQLAAAKHFAWHAADLGVTFRAMIARCVYDRGRCHESAYEEIQEAEDRTAASLRKLEAVPALKAAIEALPQSEVDAAWCQHGPLEVEDDD